MLIYVFAIMFFNMFTQLGFSISWEECLVIALSIVQALGYGF